MCPEISLIIVNWNTRDLILQCVESICETAGNLSLEVIVVDNGSTDGSVPALRRRFGDIQVVENGANLGFARANNAGLRRARGEFLGLVNSDVIVLPGCLQKLVETARREARVGLVGPKLLNADRSFQLSAKRLPNLWNTLCVAIGLHRIASRHPWFCGPEMTDLNCDNGRDVEVLAGAFWVVSRPALQKVGLLDESFFFYGEDVDWCCRLRQAGLRVIFQPAASAIHLGGASSSARADHFIHALHAAKVAYWRKHHSRHAVYCYLGICVLQHGVRLLWQFGRHLPEYLVRRQMAEPVLARWNALKCVFVRPSDSKPG